MAKSKPLTTLDEAYERAVAMLARKPRSAAEVERDLASAGADDETIASVIGRLKSHRHLDDAVLAEDQAFALLDGKGFAPQVAVQLLVERGIPSSIAHEAVEAAREGRSESALCRAALVRRLGGRSMGSASLAKEARALGRLGYDEEVIRALLERFEASS